MARTVSRPAPTATRTLLPLAAACPACGGKLGSDFHNHRTVTTLEGVFRLRLSICRCHHRACSRYLRPYRPEELRELLSAFRIVEILHGHASGTTPRTVVRFRGVPVEAMGFVHEDELKGRGRVFVIDLKFARKLNELLSRKLGRQCNVLEVTLEAKPVPSR